MGNIQLQLVQPLTEDHPLQEHLQEGGEGLHHLCFLGDDVKETLSALPTGVAARPGPSDDGPNGRKAALLDPTTTRVA
ncbi:hypothetical protein Pla144_19830 [Bythopirellula polymerisocia]|uniref:VOC domain-containing protein n=2 Tax=Bythopirellula polymerisocia TaxID=2528003 RepID=A0A5C6CYX6_9BACT|nr:hypothetical protein Pla144_19830 [Bythopirellula polymerisocia]